MHKPVMRVEGACASGGLAFTSAVDSIQAGTDITMVVGAEVQTAQAHASVGTIWPVHRTMPDNAV